MDRIVKFFRERNPQLKAQLRKAGVRDTPDYFLKKTLITAGYTTIFILMIFFLFFSKLEVVAKILILVLGLPVIFMVVFAYMMRYPDALIKKRSKLISQEIVFAGRFLVIELESGVPIYNAIKNVSKHYEYVGKEFKDIIDRVDLGTSLDIAIEEAIESTPSDNLRRMLQQINNVLKTGSDATLPLTNIIEQITKEQRIEVMEYGRKLNPLAMFYMMIAVIVPSLGIMMFVVLATFLGLNIDFIILLVIAFFLGFMQYMFLSIIKSSRPSVEL